MRRFSVRIPRPNSLAALGGVISFGALLIELTVESLRFTAGAS